MNGCLFETSFLYSVLNDPKQCQAIRLGARSRAYCDFVHPGILWVIAERAKAKVKTPCFFVYLLTYAVPVRLALFSIGVMLFSKWKLF